MRTRERFRHRDFHNPLYGPGVCLCRERCAAIILARRCPKVSSDGIRCGDWKGHRGAHSVLVDTTFVICEEAVCD